MGRKPKSMPSFFKVLIKNNTRQLRLPPVFVRKWGDIIPQIAKLRISSGQTWNVKLEKMEDEDYCFTRGWTKFSEDLGLEMGEFLVFRFTGKSTFDVSVYGMSGCEREISAINSPVKDSDPDEDDEVSKDYACTNHCDRGDLAGKAKNLIIEVESENEDVIVLQDRSDVNTIERFSKLLSQNDLYKLYIPKDFALRTGIAKIKMIHLQDSKSRAWPVHVASWKNKCSWFAFTAGWKTFLTSNKVSVGSTILFECRVSSGGLIKATVLNKGPKGSQIFQSAKRGVGRPPKVHTPLGNKNSVPWKEKCVFF